ncbi:MAG TPA: MBL fold metallo-hydrolase [Bacteroidia bacterium]|nr:MBL fold metallo-hydrolase [Bacteroidia bacterium]
MSLFVTSLNSGSNGNCYYIGNDREAVLVDAGISCRETEMRMNNLGLNIRLVKAIFISHEHADHIRGIVRLARKYKLPVYITPAALKNSPIHLQQGVARPFRADIPVAIGGLTVTAFEKLHDAIEPYSFIVEGNGVKIGVLTDIGTPCEQVIRYFKQCHAAFLESNYDEQMLEQGKYPAYLKKRIRGGKGHLSNRQALDLFMEHKPSFMSHLFLSHLSADNNSPELVHELFTRHAKETSIIIASRYKETPVYHIRKADDAFPKIKNIDVQSFAAQMSLFE